MCIEFSTFTDPTLYQQPWKGTERQGQSHIYIYMFPLHVIMSALLILIYPCFCIVSYDLRPLDFRCLIFLLTPSFSSMLLSSLYPASVVLKCPSQTQIYRRGSTLFQWSSKKKLLRFGSEGAGIRQCTPRLESCPCLEPSGTTEMGLFTQPKLCSYSPNITCLWGKVSLTARHILFSCSFNLLLLMRSPAPGLN